MSIYEEVMAEAFQDKTLPEKILSYPRERLYVERDGLFDHCRELQERILQEILQRAQGSAYAKDHGFDGCTDREAWRECCPISLYKDYAPYIEAETQDNQPHQLYHAETAMAVATTGSTGKIKLFLESEAGNAAKLLVMAVRGMIMGDLLPVTRDYSAKNLTISNYSKLGTTPSGHAVVRASGQTARNLRKQAGPMNILTVPFWEVEGLDPKDREYIVAVYALSDERMSKIFCNNLIAFGRILDLIEARGQDMIDDIRHGRFSVTASDETLAQLAPLFEKNEARADRLQQIVDESGDFFSSPAQMIQVWPNLQMASCWLSGSVGRDAFDVIQRLPKSVNVFEMGYGASEGKFNCPTALGRPSGAAAIFSIFFEFLPLDDKAAKPLCLWEVEDGACYEMLVTTYSGLYRYNMLDVVRIEGFTGNTPNIVFCGKSTETVEVNGKKLYGYQLTDLIHRIERKRRVGFDFVQVVKEEEGVAFILSSKQTVDYQQILSDIQHAFNEQWQLPYKKLYVVNKGYKQSLFDERLLPGRGACGIKMPIIVKTPPDGDVLEAVITK